MATLNLSVTIADQDLPRLLEACRDVFGNPELTEAQMTEMLRQYGITQMTQLVHNYERKLAIKAAEDAAYSIEVQ